MLIASLTTGNKVGLGLVALAFISFALITSLVIPRYRPDFPTKGQMKLFLVAAVGLFVAMLLAIEIFGVEKPEAEASGTEPTVTAPVGTTTEGTSTEGTTTEGTTTEATTTGATTTAPAAPSAADVAKGKELYTSLGCIGCHSLDGSAGTGPTFKGLAGAEVSLTNGQHVVADDAYLNLAITDPDAEIVDGFSPGLMSAVIKKGQVSPDDAKALVAFIQSQK